MQSDDIPTAKVARLWRNRRTDPNSHKIIYLDNKLSEERKEEKSFDA